MPTWKQLEELKAGRVQEVIAALEEMQAAEDAHWCAEMEKREAAGEELACCCPF